VQQKENVAEKGGKVQKTCKEENKVEYRMELSTTTPGTPQM